MTDVPRTNTSKLVFTDCKQPFIISNNHYKAAKDGARLFSDGHTKCTVVGLVSTHPHVRWLPYVRKEGLPLECSYREMEWKSCNGSLIPNFPVKTFHFLSGKIRTCLHAELRQAEGWAAPVTEQLAINRVDKTGGASAAYGLRCSIVYSVSFTNPCQIKDILNCTTMHSLRGIFRSLFWP